MRNFIQDLRYAVRMMAKRPGFTIVAARLRRIVALAAIYQWKAKELEKATQDQ